MELQTLTFWIVGITFSIYIGIALWTKARSTDEFYVASGDIHPIANGMATAADWMSAASFISMAGMIAFLGYGGSVFLMGWTGGYVLLALLIAPYLRKHGSFTVPQFISDRYYSKTARVIAVVCLIIASVTYVIGQMKGIGVAFGRFLEIPESQGLMVGMGIVFIYAVMGGMKGITYTQIAQYIIMIFAYTIPAIFISLMLTSSPIPQIGLGSTMQQDGSNLFLLDKLDQIIKDLGFKEGYTTDKGGGLLNMFFYTLSLMVGTAGLPHVIMRFFTVRSVKAARSSAGWALVFIAILYTTAPAVGAMARLNLITIITKNNNLPEDDLLYSKRPQWFKKWEKTELLAWIDKNSDGRIQYNYGHAFDGKKPKYELDSLRGNKLSGKFGQPILKNDPTKNNNELYVDNDIMVLANPEIAGLPNWIIALVAAGGLAAALSTAAGLLLAISSAISHDLLKGVFRPKISELDELKASRIAMALSIAVAGYLGLNQSDFAAGTVALAFGLAASSLFPALMMGIFSKTMNKEGAIAGMLAGISVTLLYVFQHKGIMFIQSTSFLGSMDPNWFLGIEPNAFGAIGAIVNFAIAFIVSKKRPRPPEKIKKMIEQIRLP
tara:strand:+ start:843 stop:2663 length:1821 start_codon:yes stop_codon:yes gene_type:complete